MTVRLESEDGIGLISDRRVVMTIRVALFLFSISDGLLSVALQDVRLGSVVTLIKGLNGPPKSEASSI